MNFCGWLRGVPFTRSVYASCISGICERRLLFPQRAFGIARRSDLLAELTEESRRDIRFPRIPCGLFFVLARSFQLLPFGFPFGAVLLHEKRSAVSFPPDVAPSKDTRDHWTLLHEIYTVTYVRIHLFPFSLSPARLRTYVRYFTSNSYRYSIVTFSRLS